jgi:CO dehydrogenase maturation factor
MRYVIAIAGKGGVGKTTIAAFLIKELSRNNGPILAIDADPNSNLNILLGMSYNETIADIREEAKSHSSASMSKSDFFNMRLQEIVTEGDGVDLLVMGRPEGSGCYCAVNNILRDYLSMLSKNYKYVVIDNEAGMEHLSRCTADSVDNLVLVSDTTMVGIRSAINAFNTAKKSGLKVKSFSLLVNKSSGGLDREKKDLLGDSGLNITGYVPFKKEIEDNSEAGLGVPQIRTASLISVLSSLIK